MVRPLPAITKHCAPSRSYNIARHIRIAATVAMTFISYLAPAMNSIRHLIIATLLTLMLRVSSEAVQLEIPTVHVGNAGNAGEAQADGTYGHVAYEYRIGAYEVSRMG